MPESAANITEFPQTELSEIERETIDLFVHFAQLFSLPKSLGEIFGLLFASENPLTFDSIVEKLQISRGSASQGLRFLRSIGAVHTVYVPGDRKDHYIAEDRLRPLLSGFLRERFLPHLNSGEERIKRLQQLIEESGEEAGPNVQRRMDRLQKWNVKAENFLPLILKLMDPK